MTAAATAVGGFADVPPPAASNGGAACGGDLPAETAGSDAQLMALVETLAWQSEALSKRVYGEKWPFGPGLRSSGVIKS